MTKTLASILALDQWGIGLNPLSQKLIIAGPCSAESSQQLMQTALGLEGSGHQILRAGIWKPRTRPGSFEGVGDVALPWLRAAGEATKKLTTVEVANPRHLQQALIHGVDIIWVGARTTVNPFAVQELADAMTGIDVPVLVKNPVNPDLNLWIGALERFYQAGVRRLGAIHRGFSTYGDTEYRNRPNWEIPLELKRQFPDLPLLCDPSHICGRRDTLQFVAQKSMDLNFDGLMLECHVDPDRALSDAAQQLKPDSFKGLMAKLVIRKMADGDQSVEEALQEMRSRIDQMDRQSLSLLASRMEVVRDIGDFKRKHDITIYQAERWDSVRKDRMQQGKSLGLSESFLGLYCDNILRESIRHQTRVMNGSIEAFIDPLSEK